MSGLGHEILLYEQAPAGNVEPGVSCWDREVRTNSERQGFKQRHQVPAGGSWRLTLCIPSVCDPWAGYIGGRLWLLRGKYELKPSRHLDLMLSLADSSEQRDTMI